MAFSADHGENQGDRIYVYFCGEKNVSKAAMKT
jgi:DNA-directed RNA polymerase I, II, and III subunit RPABC1